MVKSLGILIKKNFHNEANLMGNNSGFTTKVFLNIVTRYI